MSLTTPAHCTAAVPRVRGTQLMWLSVLGAVAALILLGGLSGLGPSGPGRATRHAATSRPLPAQTSSRLARTPLGLAYNPRTHRWTCVAVAHEHRLD